MTGSDIANKQLSRREFLRIGGLAMAAVGVLLAGCRPAATNETASEANGQRDTSASVAAPTVAIPQPTSQAAATPTPAAQQDLGVACPFGLVNDPYPGRCKRYHDSDGNGYCDFSALGSGSMRPRS